MLAIAGLLAGTRSHKPTGLPPHFLIEANQWIEEEPTSPIGWVSRASIYFYQQQFDEGTRDLWKAIHLNPGDLGQNYSPTTGVELSPDALKHGEEQLHNMLRDRPEMAEHVNPGDEIWNWTVRKFAGEDFGSPVYWDASDPSPFDGDSRRPGNGQAGAIRVRQVIADSLPADTSAFDFLWAVAVFELHNVNSIKDWDNIEQQALDGKLNREQYILAKLRSEQPAVQRTRAFYLQRYLPWLREKGKLKTSPGEWQCYLFHTSDDSQRQTWQSYPHWNAFAGDFDLTQIAREFNQGNFQCVDKQLKALEERIARLSSDEQRSHVHYWRAHWYLVKSNPERALLEFDKAVMRPPFFGVALGRAQALHLSGKLDQAIQVLSDWLKQHFSDIGSSYEAFCYRATLSAEQGNRPQALADLAEAIRILPNQTDAYGERGQILFQLKKWDEALADFDAAIRLAPENSTNYAWRSWVYLKLKQLGLAEADIAQALELEPDSADALAGRASLAVARELQSSAVLSGAIADAMRSCELSNWQHVDYIDLLAEAHRKNGDNAEALKWERKAREVGAAATIPSASGSDIPAAKPDTKDSSIILPHAKFMLAAH